MSLVHLLSNPAVRSKRRLAANEQIRHAIEARGYSAVELRPASRDLIVPTINEACSDGVTRLVIAGGDGLVHQALPAIAGRDIVVGVVPVGTGNDFVRALDLPTSRGRKLDTAIDAALSEPSEVDLIAVGDPAAPSGWAATVVTGGFSGRVNARANDLRLPPGQQKYTVATFLELASLAPIELELTVDDTPQQLESTLFAVANTPFFGGGMAICPDAKPDDGLLDVTVVGPTTRRELAMVLPRVFSGSHVTHRSVTTYQGARVTIGTPADLWADGEPLLDKQPGERPDEGQGAHQASRSAQGPNTTRLTAAPGALRVAGSLKRT